MRQTLVIICLVSFACLSVANDKFLAAYSQGLALMKNGEFQQAIELFGKACKAAAGDSPERNKALRGEGMAHYRIAQEHHLRQDYQGAYARYGEAMKCFAKGGHEKNVIDCVFVMAKLNHHYLGSLETAAAQYGRAYDMAVRSSLVKTQADILAEIISLKKELHKEDEATAHAATLDSLLAAQESAQAMESRLIRRGDDTAKNGDNDLAISIYMKVLAMKKQPADALPLQQKLRDIHMRKGDYEAALAYSEECIRGWKEVFKDNPRQKPLIYRNHYAIQLKVGDYDGALESIDSLQVAAAYDDDPLMAGRLSMDKGYACSAMGKWDLAVENYRLADSLLSKSKRRTAVDDINKQLLPLHAAALYHKGDCHASFDMYARNLKMTKKFWGKKSLEYAQALCYLANIEGFLGRFEAGAAHYVESWETARDIVAQDLQLLPSNARGKYWADINDLMWDMIPYALATGCQENRLTASAFESLMFSKGLLLSLEKSTGSMIQSLGDDKLLAGFMTIANLRNEIESLRSQKDGEGVTRLYATMDSLDRALAIDLRAKGVTSVIDKVSSTEIIEGLNQGEALVDFADFVKKDGSHIYAAFVVRPDREAPRLIEVFRQAQLDSLLSSNLGRYSDLYAPHNQKTMYELIWQPLMDHIKDSRRIYFVPSGIINQLAVEAVQLPDGRFIGDAYDIVRLSNSKEMLSYEDNVRINDFGSARLFGGLEYDVEPDTMVSVARRAELPPLLALRGSKTQTMGSNEGFRKLKMSESEVTQIKETLTAENINVTILTGNEGSEESFVGMSGDSPDLLLVSTHGFYYSPDNVPSWSSLNGYDDPMYLTGLVMSGGNAEYLRREIPEGVMGGLLTSSEIACLDLSNTQLAILSACETGLGTTTNEGVYGLQRAFKNAGAQTLVMSLWPVSDLAAKEFMTTFHRQLADNGWDKRTAFKNTRSAIRKKYGNPFYWASFIIID